MKYVNVENFSDLVDSKVILSNHNNCTGTIEKYENEKFYVRYESGNTLKQYSTEDFKEGHIVLDDKEKENAVLLKIRLSELKIDFKMQSENLYSRIFNCRSSIKPAFSNVFLRYALRLSGSSFMG